MKKVIAILFLAVLAAGAFIGWGWYQDNRMPNFKGSADIYVRPGDTVEDVISQIKEQTTIINESRLRAVFEEKQVKDYLKPGYFRLGKSNSSVYAARMLNNGWQSPVRLTLSGNLRIKSNIAAKIASQLLIDSLTVLNALNDTELLGKYGYTPQTVFSMLVPDTYEIYWTASIEDIFEKNKKASDAFWTEENLSRAEALGLTRKQASTLASIVASESNYAPELPLIAGVYLNRLSIGMPLQADPTVAFCFDYKPERILKRHLEVDSPYNTYKHNGLPPGPICVPTREALDAVLHPDFGGVRGSGGNLYFCANPDFSGKHIFAKTLTQHNANARAFQNELTRRARAKRAAGK